MIELVAEHPLQHKMLGAVNVRLFQDAGSPASPVVVLTHGDVTRVDRPVVRVQSACLYGDTLGAADCDCYDQLQASLRRLEAEGAGIVFYTPQEGRGAGLVAKARAYAVQHERDIDTVEAYELLGYDLDDREYEDVAEILKSIGVTKVLLLTNNPRKSAGLKTFGIDVIPGSIKGSVTTLNRNYLVAKQQKLGHDLGLRVLQDTQAVKGLTVGAAVMDHVFNSKQTPRLGHATQADEYARRPGGKGLNQAIAFARLGGRSTVLSVRGQDHDANVIANTLALEGVTAASAPSIFGHRTPQTAVLQPYSGAPTYVGWLGESQRTLRSQTIQKFLDVVLDAEIILMTLEVSSEALKAVSLRASKKCLRVLTASPRAEDAYGLESTILEDMDVIIGSPDELAALMGIRQNTKKATPNLDDVVSELSDASRRLVIGTDFRRSVRTAVCRGHMLDEPIRVHSPRVLMPGSADLQVTPAVGNTDVFAAAVGLSLCQARRECDDNKPPNWKERGSILARRVTVIDALSYALQAEAWVARSRMGGYPNFPKAGEEFDSWCRDHPVEVQ